MAVGLRRSSPTFGVWVGVELSTKNKRMLWIPPSFAQSFLALKDYTDFLYKYDARYAPEHEYSLARALCRAPVIWGLLAKGGLNACCDGDAGVASWFDFAVTIQEEALAPGLLETQSRSPPIPPAPIPSPPRDRASRCSIAARRKLCWKTAKPTGA